MQAYKLLYLVCFMSVLALGVCLIYEGDLIYQRLIGLSVITYAMARVDEQLNTNENEN